MANKQKNYWYVIVMTNEGAMFVTDIDYSNKIAHWDKSKPPKEMGQSRAKDLAFGLTANWHQAYAVTRDSEITEQPFLYDKGHFEWVWNKKEESA